MKFLTVKNWIKSIKSMLFSYNDGFFELPYLCNSPMEMLESLKRLPVHRYDKEQQAIYTKNPFTTGVMRFQKVEEGFWVIAVEIKFHMNVRTIALFDDTPKEYYFLSYSLYASEVTANLKNKVKLESNIWTLYAPGNEIDAYHHKGTSCLVFQFVFKHSWLEKNVIQNYSSGDNSLKQFLKSDAGFTYWQDFVPKAETIARKIWKTLKEENNTNLKTITTKMLSLEMVLEFFSGFLKYDYQSNYAEFHEGDKKSIARAERIILDNLTKPFPGIEQIASSVSLSPTKLKACFKTVYGKPLFTYYKEKQMQLALQMLNCSSMQIKEVAYTLGYESPSKFTAAFKSFHKILPSEAVSNINFK